MLKRIFYDTFIRTEEESIEYLRSVPKGKADWKVMIICVTVALSVTLIYYFGDHVFCEWVLDHLGMHDWSARLSSMIADEKTGQLNRLTYWVCVLVFCYFVLPFLTITLLFRENLPAYGFNPRGALKDYHVYVLMLVVMIPLVLYFSTTQSFQARYPFYHLAAGEGLWPNFWIWQGLYLIQFFALEFFFRGFMVHGLKHRFGFYSVFVMTIPYCMIHFGKPMPETIAAIIAGIVLGTLSLKGRSIWLGIAIHYTVAISMDLASLWRKGLL